MTYHWYRTASGGSGFGFGNAWMCAIPAGSTYRRVRFTWGFQGHTPTTSDMSDLMGLPFVMGLCTTIGNGSETPPNPTTASGDAAPPTQRWIWWENRGCTVTGIDQGSGVVSWSDTGPQEEVDVKVNVLATGIPAGDTLNLWASWSGWSGWEAGGYVGIWLATSVLYSTP